MEYQHDIFYDIEQFPFEKIMVIVREAKKMSDDVVVDKIIGLQRRVQPEADSEKWLDEYPKPDSIFRFIHRRGYSNPFHIQVVIRENEDFLWINLPEDRLAYFQDKYKMRIL